MATLKIYPEYFAGKALLFLPPLEKTEGFIYRRYLDF
ncbi:MAG: hypothetical protein ACI8PB_005079 [Desulforhopalus sp.]|jgi:hypothetical protein